MSNNIFHFRLQLKDTYKQVNINDSGATAFICNAGTSVLATLQDQYGNALANPIQPTSGLIDFYVSESAASSPANVDIYGMTAGGYWFEYKAAAPSGPNEINCDTLLKRMRMKIPFAIGNTGPAGACVAATEFQVGIKLPASAFILDRLHGAGVQMTVAQASKTIQVGILSTDTGGAASGFINGSSLGPTAPSLLVVGTNGSLFSLNAPYTTDTETGGVANGLDVSLTLSSGTTTAQGFVELPYMLP